MPRCRAQKRGLLRHHVAFYRAQDEWENIFYFISNKTLPRYFYSMHSTVIKEYCAPCTYVPMAVEYFTVYSRGG